MVFVESRTGVGSYGRITNPRLASDILPQTFSESPKPPIYHLVFYSSSTKKLEIFANGIAQAIDPNVLAKKVKRSYGEKSYYEIDTPEYTLVISHQRLPDDLPDPEKQERRPAGYQPEQKASVVSYGEGQIYITADVYLQPAGCANSDPELSKPKVELNSVQEKIAYMESSLLNGLYADSSIESHFEVHTSVGVFIDNQQKIKYIKTIDVRFSKIPSHDLIREFIIFCEQKGVDINKVSGALPISEWIFFLRNGDNQDLNITINGIDVRKLDEKQVKILSDMLIGSFPTGFGKMLAEIFSNPKNLKHFIAKINPIEISDYL